MKLKQIVKRKNVQASRPRSICSVRLRIQSLLEQYIAEQAGKNKGQVKHKGAAILAREIKCKSFILIHQPVQLETSS